MASRHADVILRDSSLKHVSISTLVASYYIEATERGTVYDVRSEARRRRDSGVLFGCVPAIVQRGQMIVPYRQRYRLLRPLPATAVPRDRDAWPATGTARRLRRTTVDTASAGTITLMRPRRTRDRTQRTADQPARTPIVHLPPRRPSTQFRPVDTAPPIRHLHIADRAARPAPCASRPCGVHPRAGDRTRATYQPADSTTDRASASTPLADCVPWIVQSGPTRCTARQCETAAANTPLHRAPGELHPRSDDRAVAGAQQADRSP
jgi:hypothetical protein